MWWKIIGLFIMVAAVLLAVLSAFTGTYYDIPVDLFSFAMGVCIYTHPISHW